MQLVSYVKSHLHYQCMWDSFFFHSSMRQVHARTPWELTKVKETTTTATLRFDYCFPLLAFFSWTSWGSPLKWFSVSLALMRLGPPVVSPDSPLWQLLEYILWQNPISQAKRKDNHYEEIKGSKSEKLQKLSISLSKLAQTLTALGKEDKESPLRINSS